MTLRIFDIKEYCPAVKSQEQFFDIFWDPQTDEPEVSRECHLSAKDGKKPKRVTLKVSVTKANEYQAHIHCYGCPLARKWTRIETFSKE